MKKIGVVSKVEYSGPGTEKIYYNRPEDSYTYISFLAIDVFDEETQSLKQVQPQYNPRLDYYLLGNVVEYNDETNTIDRFGLFKGLTETQINDLSNIYKSYLERLRTLKDSDILTVLSKCTDISQIKEVINTHKNQNSLMEKVNIELILKGIRAELAYLQKSKSTDIPRAFKR